jgi:hypothetical protein
MAVDIILKKNEQQRFGNEDQHNKQRQTEPFP